MIKTHKIIVLVLWLLTACAPALQAASVTPTITDLEIAPTETAVIAVPTDILPPMASLDDEKFDQSLVQAVEQLDFEEMRAAMQDRFLIANWQANLLEYDSEEALQRLQESVFAQGAKPTARFESDIVALLSGTDPLSIWGPVANPARALHVTGLGSNANQEAVIVIGSDKITRKLFWLGILLPRAGSFSILLPDPAEVVETEVEYVMAKADLNARLGPGTEYAVVGLVKAGQIAQVTGASPDGMWWRILCVDDPSGICWISADPTLSEPGSAP